MREIKFRAKVCKPLIGVIFIPSYRKEGEWVIGDLHLRTKIPHIHECGNDKFPIDINTIGQFTGMTDKDGKEIYEGDILDLFIPKNNVGKPEHRLRKVIFDEKSCGFSIVDKHNNCICDAVTTSIELIYTVIGNIYDNPEMMEAKQ